VFKTFKRYAAFQASTSFLPRGAGGMKEGVELLVRHRASDGSALGLNDWNGWNNLAAPDSNTAFRSLASEIVAMLNEAFLSAAC
jgi:hypothetical protein